MLEHKKETKMKSNLTAIDKIKAAYYYHVRGMDQALITEVLECTNPGRVNEAIKEIEKTIGMNHGGYRSRTSQTRRPQR
jgi:hypothetical protein